MVFSAEIRRPGPDLGDRERASLDRFLSVTTVPAACKRPDRGGSRPAFTPLKQWTGASWAGCRPEGGLERLNTEAFHPGLPIDRIPGGRNPRSRQRTDLVDPAAAALDPVPSLLPALGCRAVKQAPDRQSGSPTRRAKSDLPTDAFAHEESSRAPRPDERFATDRVVPRRSAGASALATKQAPGDLPLAICGASYCCRGGLQ